MTSLKHIWIDYSQ